MTNMLILGAHGQIARVATDLLLNGTDARVSRGSSPTIPAGSSIVRA